MISAMKAIIFADQKAFQRCLLTGLLILVVTSCKADADNTTSRKVNLSSAETWLLPNEIRNGRKLTLAGISGLYVTTPKHCVVANEDPNEPSLAPELIELAALINGVERNGKRVDPLANLVGALSNLSKTYTLPSGQPFGKIIVGQSLTCRAEHGERIDPRAVVNLPDRIHIHLRNGTEMMPLPEHWVRESKTQVSVLTEAGKPYCRVALAIQGSLIMRARIDAFVLSRELPHYSDYKTMDCIMRGVIASTGFTGILRYDLRDIYNDEDILQPSVAHGYYTNKLLNGFGAFQEKIWLAGGKI
jgi:hypothetical protein